MATVSEKPGLRRIAKWHSIALVGVDGSGKSTQAGLLRQKLEARENRVLLIHPFGHKLLASLHPLGIKIVRTLLGGRSRSATPASTNKEDRPLAARVEAFFELLDIGIYTWGAYIRSRVMTLDGKSEVWIVSDRSFDDLLVKHRRLQRLSKRELSWARRIVPIAEKTVWLQTEPRVAMERDHDFSFEYYGELNRDYQTAASEYGWQIVPTSGRVPDEVAADIGLILANHGR